MSTTDENDLSGFRRDHYVETPKASILSVEGNQDRLSYVTHDRMDDFEPANKNKSLEEAKSSIALILKKSKSLNSRHAKITQNYG